MVIIQISKRDSISSNYVCKFLRFTIGAIGNDNPCTLFFCPISKCLASATSTNDHK
uniref:3-dehydroquinate dehydratase/shikimate 5-dehydrogenase n=1 Tax=Rhizophora mucronata TaxID=61149 RepID=A0A2P2L5F5_RHIMU